MVDLNVCEGATCTCDMGTAPATLIVTSQAIEDIDGLLVATIMDYSPTVNIPTFGTCAVLTAAAEGVSTPCVPATVAPWTPGSVIESIDGMMVLTNACTLTCSEGGLITITSPANTISDTE